MTCFRGRPLWLLPTGANKNVGNSQGMIHVSCVLLSLFTSFTRRTRLWKQLYCVTLDFPSNFICFLLRARLFAGGVTPCGSQNPATAIVYFVLNFSIYCFMGTLCSLMRFILFSGSELPNRTRNFCLEMLPTCQQKNKIDGANNPSNAKRSWAPFRKHL